MIKQTLYFSNPAYLSLASEQLVIKTILDGGEQQEQTRPIEDIAMIILDHAQITLTQKLLAFLTQNNVAIVSCDDKHHPIGLMLPLDTHTLQSQRFQAQIDASQALKKNLWQQTIVAKIQNQSNLLQKRKIAYTKIQTWANEVKTGDTTNVEAKAAAYYWNHLFPHINKFTRGREDAPPNNLLNYGYAILRASVARALVASGLLPTLGIHHKNKYNAYCLADDIMEPYRPFVDNIVCHIVDTQTPNEYAQITKVHKALLFQINALDIVIDGEKRPLMIGLQRSTASLVACYEGKARKIIYPHFH